MPGQATRLSRLAYFPVFLLCFVAVDGLRAQDTTVLPQAQVGKPYSISIGVDTENGKGQFTWKLAKGDLPPGLQVSAVGKIEGTPTDTKSDPYVFDLNVSDSSQPPQYAVLRFSLGVAAAALRIKGVKVATTQLKVLGVNTVAASPSESTSAGSTAAASGLPMASQPATPAPDPPASPKPLVVQPDSSALDSRPSADPVAIAKADDPPKTGDQAKADTPKFLNCSSQAEQTGICGGPMLRTIVGFEQAGVSSASSKQDFFFDLMYDRPLGFQVDPSLGAALRSWGNLRISSVPQQIDSGVAQFAADFAQKVGALKVNQVAQSFEFLGGIQYRLFTLPSKTTDPNDKKKKVRVVYATDPPYDAVQRQAVSVNLIAGGGVITPLTPQDSVQIFNVPSNQPNFLTQYPQAMGKQFVAFTLQDRNRFFRQAYGGVRLMTHFLGDVGRVRYPETFDVSYGFNESVTGGRIRGGVLRLEGFAPIPYAKASWIYFFGTGIFKPGSHAITANPFILDQAPTGTLPTNSGAVIISTPQADRDYYRIGVGIDFIELIKNWNPKPPANADTTKTDASAKAAKGTTLQ